MNPPSLTPPAMNPRTVKTPPVKSRALQNSVAAVLAAIFGVLLTVFAAVALVAASIRVSNITSPSWRLLAISGEIAGGVVWLLGAVYAATHLAVMIFAAPESPLQTPPETRNVP